VLGKLAEFQAAGHTVVLIVGDFTRGSATERRSASRPVATAEEIEANATTYQEQAYKILDPERTEVRRNSEWLQMGTDSLLRLMATTTVARLLERDDFQNRMAANAPIAATSCSIRCCRATTRSRPGPTSSSAAPTRGSTCSSGATCRAPTGCRSSRSLRCRSWSGPTACRR